VLAAARGVWVGEGSGGKAGTSSCLHTLPLPSLGNASLLFERSATVCYLRDDLVQQINVYVFFTPASNMERLFVHAQNSEKGVHVSSILNTGLGLLVGFSIPKVLGMGGETP